MKMNHSILIGTIIICIMIFIGCGKESITTFEPTNTQESQEEYAIIQSADISEVEPNNEYGDAKIITIIMNDTYVGKVSKPGDFSDLWYIKAGASGNLSIKNRSTAFIWMEIWSFSNNYGGPGNMFKHIVRLMPGRTGTVNLQASRYYVVNVSVPFMFSNGGNYKFDITGTWK